MATSFEKQLLDLIKQFSRAALQQRPANLTQFALVYFTELAARQDHANHLAEPFVSDLRQKEVQKNTNLDLTQLKKLYQNISAIDKACTEEVSEDLFAFLDTSRELQSRLVSFTKNFRSLGDSDFANKLMVFACMVEATSFLEFPEAVKRLFEIYARPKIQVEKLLVLLSHMNKNELNYEEFASSPLIEEYMCGSVGDIQKNK